ncbi:hypothetical protein GOBAR_DD17574 [Gossypium barbadense]|nr:hypothetical protein GOBAR_DD17574 [Gossypium barbadense]
MAFQQILGPSSGSSSSSGFQYMNSPFGDTTYTKVFVGGLAWETQSETMRRYFEQFGEIVEAVVITDKNTGRSKGYGFGGSKALMLKQCVVTFRDPESARRACADPTPIIDGRRANCNLASLGRPRPPVPYGINSNLSGRLRPPSPYIGGVPRGAYVGSIGYQPPLPYNYQQGLMYPSYGNAKVVVAEDMCPSSMYATYGPEYVYPQVIGISKCNVVKKLEQGAYNPYVAQQYLQIYGVPGAVNPVIYPYGQLGQTVPSGHGYTAVQGYAMPSHQIVQFGGAVANAITTSPMPTIQTPYPGGIAASVPTQPQFIVTTPQFMQGLRAAELLLEWRASDLALQVIYFAFYRSYVVMLTREVNVVRVAPFRWRSNMEEAEREHYYHTAGQVASSHGIDGCWKGFLATT